MVKPEIASREPGGPKRGKSRGLGCQLRPESGFGGPGMRFEYVREGLPSGLREKSLRGAK